MGVLLIGALMVDTDGYIGWRAVLPLLATYPLSTALTAFDPLRAAVQFLERRLQRDWGTTLRRYHNLAS